MWPWMQKPDHWGILTRVVIPTWMTMRSSRVDSLGPLHSLPTRAHRSISPNRARQPSAFAAVCDAPAPGPRVLRSLPDLGSNRSSPLSISFCINLSGCDRRLAKQYFGRLQPILLPHPGGE